MIDVKLLNDAQDRIYDNLDFWPKEDDPDHKTFCNVATIAVAQGVGCRALDSPVGIEPLTADEIYRLMLSETLLFAPMVMRQCQDRVNAGALMFAILPSWKLQQSHGHICTLTTGMGDHSGRWNTFTPFCMNLGRAGTCFRKKGVNWAFQTVPEIFAWVQ